MSFPKIPMDKWVDQIVDWLQVHLAPLFAMITELIEPTVSFFQSALMILPSMITALVLTVLVFGRVGYPSHCSLFSVVY